MNIYSLRRLTFSLALLVTANLATAVTAYSLPASGLPASASPSTVPSTLPLLAKRFSSINPSGKIRSSECLVFPDGVTINNSVDGLDFSVERSGSVSSAITTRINEAAAAKTVSTQRTPITSSYSLVAFRASASGIQESVVISAFDGSTGIETTNPTPAAIVLKEVANSLCN